MKIGILGFSGSLITNLNSKFRNSKKWIENGGPKYEKWLSVRHNGYVILNIEILNSDSVSATSNTLGYSISKIYLFYKFIYFPVLICQFGSVILHFENLHNSVKKIVQ